MSDSNPAEGVGQSGQYKDATDKYDAEHGKYQSNVPRDGQLVGLPNSSPSAPDPSPFKLGPT
jgi:hypothetical protein